MKKLLLLTINFNLFISLLFAQVPEYWGMTAYGGSSNSGAIFKTDAIGSNYSLEYSFKIKDGSPTYTKLLESTNGKLYGLTTYGGENGLGVVFEYDTLLETYEILASFSGENGTAPKGSLIEATNGKIYGMTSAGGSSDDGVIFEFDYLTNTINKLIDFDGVDKGSFPHGSLTEAANGKLYGMTTEGGVSDIGVLFEYEISTNTFIKKFDFDGANKGEWPFGSLIQATNGKLYGVANEGGVNDLGVLFEYDIATNTFVKKLDFDDVNGKWPIGGVMQASNGKLYGLTYLGGANGLGLIYEYDLVANVYTKKFDFDGVIGSYPIRDLTEASNGKLYGLTSFGGLTNGGVLFEYDILTNGYTKKVDFNTYNGTPNWSGSLPQGSLIEASNGMMYGLTFSGGSKASGVLFEYDFNSESFDKKYDFGGSINGHEPRAGLLQATDGFLYGATRIGGDNDLGVIFKYDPKTKNYTKIIDFDGTLNGSDPRGSLFQASNGKIYGLASMGGNFNQGTMYEIDPSTESFMKIIDFQNGYGKIPRGNINEHVNGNLYWVASQSAGGTGAIIEYNLTTNVLTRKYNFGSSFGNTPTSGLFLASNNKFYGTTIFGGTSGIGVIYEYDPVTDNYVKLHNFQSINGKWPNGEIVEADNGKLYGLTQTGGTNDLGVLYEYDIVTQVFTKRHDFNSINGTTPFGELLNSTNGKLYGFTSMAGLNNSGVIFEFDIDSNTYTKKYDLIGRTGSLPTYGKLFETNICYNSIEDINLTSQNSYTSPSGNYTWTESGIYQDTLFAMNTCGGDSILSINLTIEKNINNSIQTNSFNSLKYYPNPTQGNLVLELGEHLDNISVSLQTIQGKEISLLHYSNAQKLDLEYDIPKGIYFIKIQAGELQQTIRIIKQ